MTTTEFTKQERDLLIAALDNQQECYEGTAHWLFYAYRAIMTMSTSQKSDSESIRRKILLLDVDDEKHHHPSS